MKRNFLLLVFFILQSAWLSGAPYSSNQTLVTTVFHGYNSLYDDMSVWCHKSDTVISGYTFANYKCGWFYEDKGKIHFNQKINILYRHVSGGNDSSLLYNFNIAKGDSVWFGAGKASYRWLYCDSIITTKMASGQFRKNYYLTQRANKNHYHWIEGFGDITDNPFTDFDPGINLVSYSDTSGLVYLDTTKFIYKKFYTDISRRKGVKGFMDSCLLKCNGTITRIQNAEAIPTNEISIFPNPCHGVLNISAAEKGIFKLEIISLTGQVIKSAPLRSDGNTSYSLNGLKNGIYILQVYLDNKIIRKKLILE